MECVMLTSKCFMIWLQNIQNYQGFERKLDLSLYFDNSWILIENLNTCLTSAMIYDLFCVCVCDPRPFVHFFCCFKIKIESFTFEKERNNEFEILNPFWAYIKESWSTLLIEINPLYVFRIYHWIIFSEKTRKYLLATYILDHNYCRVNHF